MKFYVLLFLLILNGIYVSAQNIEVSGKIVSSLDNEPLIGVNVTLKGTNIGTISDVDGMYKINNVPSNAVLSFSYIGYESANISVDGRNVIDLNMIVSNVLTEVVVTSFGIAKDKKVLGYGSQKISGDDLRKSNQQNLVNGLQGRLAGVTINSAGGAPGAGANINIRGINSIGGSNDNQPLFVVDGIIISNATNAGNVRPSAGSNAINDNEQFMNTNRVADINPDDIESMNVLKGAAATALYGQRASNGAVIITTKKGKSGVARIDYSMSYGVQNVDKVPELQTVYYQGLTGIQRLPPALIFWQFGPQALAGDPFANHFRDFFRTGNTINHSLSFSGGTEKSTFLTSASYFNNEGIVPNSDFNRITAKVSASHKLTDKLNVGAQVNYAKSAGASPPSGDKSIYSALTFWSPNFNVNDYVNADGSEKDYSSGTIDQPRYVAETSPLNTDVNRVFGDINLEYTFNSWLKAKYQIAADYYNDKRNRAVGADLDAGSQVKGFYMDQNISSSELNSNLFLMSEHKLSNDFALHVTLGHNVTDQLTSSRGVRGEGFIAPGFFNLSNTSNIFVIAPTDFRKRLVGVLGDVRLDYKDYLYLNITGRNDWSSTLPKENRSFFYPSVSLAYILTNSILKSNGIISYAKLRGSFAQVGKDASPYQIGSYFGIVPGFPFGSIGGFRRDLDIGNYNLKPEITTENEIGLETSLFNNLISLEANYFVRKSKNQILPVGVSNVTGYSSYVTNAGVIQNKGIELLLGVTPIKGAFRWDVSLNWTRIRSVVESMPENLKTITYYDQGRTALRIEEGGSMGDLYGYEWTKNSNGEIIIGTNGLPTLDQTKYVKIGNALPDWTGGLSNTFSFKGLTLDVLLEMRQGGDVVDIGEINAIRNGTAAFTVDRNKAVIWNGVTVDGSPNTTVAIFDENTYRAFGINAHHSFNIQDASWFRVRSAGLSYEIPKSILGNKLRALSIGITGSNLFLSTPFRGYDPEALAFGSGSNFVGYTGRNTPNTRNFNFNVRVGF
ncbi:MAG: SusC/RagA family TonB-linked outer membrane protein [Saprospiraceae bacterium]|nr:SusC/RagA family TonB-linked outer membrane protein [Saprospiraceae bacterium]